MPKPRKGQLSCIKSFDATPYYHCCVSSCVPKTLNWAGTMPDFLYDTYDYSEIVFFVGYIDEEKAKSWTTEEIVERWHQLFNGTLLTQRFSRRERLCPVECEAVDIIAKKWRSRLMSLSWYMRVLNESTARQANEEDYCTGRFWGRFSAPCKSGIHHVHVNKGRFKSQGLLDESALISCMAYVDLNPVRAKMAKTPEESDHTSIQKRIAHTVEAAEEEIPISQPEMLMDFMGNPREPMPHGLPFHFKDYLELVDWTGRIVSKNKRGFIPDDLPPIFERLAINSKHWVILAQKFESRFKSMASGIDTLTQACENFDYRRRPGVKNSMLFH